MIRFATWNVNSLKVRQERVEQWLADVAPDIVCMQETKLADSAFPQLAFEALGYDRPPTTARAGGTAWRSCRGAVSTTCRSGSPTTPSPTPRPG